MANGLSFNIRRNEHYKKSENTITNMGSTTGGGGAGGLGPQFLEKINEFLKFTIYF